jgi:hypothetical protein
LATDMTPELVLAVENAYREFARYHLRGAIAVCKCDVCVSDEGEKALCVVPLRQISSRLLAEYTQSAHGFDDRVADELRYFLPRYFELIAAGEIPCNNGLETCLGRMLHAAYGKDWPQEEADAIDGFFVALFRAELGKPLGPADYSLFDAGEGAEAVLCCMAHAGGDVRLLLDVWERTAGREADVRIARTIVAADWRIRDLSNTWWSVADRKPVRQAMNTIIAWLLRTETWERLEAACLNETDSMTAELFSQAQSMIARYS